MDSEFGWEEVARLVGFREEKVYFAATKLKDAYINLILPMAAKETQELPLSGQEKEKGPVVAGSFTAGTQISPATKDGQANVPSQGNSTSADDNLTAQRLQNRQASEIDAEIMLSVSKADASVRMNEPEDASSSAQEAAADSESRSGTGSDHVHSQLLRPSVLPQDSSRHTRLTERASGMSVGLTSVRSTGVEASTEQPNSSTGAVGEQDPTSESRTVDSMKRKRGAVDERDDSKRTKRNPETVTGVESQHDIAALRQPAGPHKEGDHAGEVLVDDPMDIDTEFVAAELPRRKRTIAAVRQQRAAEAKKATDTPSRPSRHRQTALTAEGVSVAFASQPQEIGGLIDEDESMIDSSYIHQGHAAEAAQRREEYDADQRQAAYRPGEYLEAARAKLLDRP